MKNDDNNSGISSKRPGWNLKNKAEEATVVETTVAEEATVERKKERKLPKIQPKMAGIVAAVVAVIVIAIFAFAKIGGNSESNLQATFIEMGRDWYENFYYDGFDEKSRSEILGRFTEIGIKVDLDNMSRFKSDENAEKLGRFKAGEADGYDATETKIVIRPKEPYGKSDYEIEAIMVKTSEVENK